MTATNTFGLWKFGAVGHSNPLFPAPLGSKNRYIVTPYNRILSGVLIGQERRSASQASSKYSYLMDTTTTAAATATSAVDESFAPFGVDAVFMATATGVYNRYANISAYSADERRSTGLPYAFFVDQGVSSAAQVAGETAVAGVGTQVVKYPVLFDINLSEEQATNFLQYMEYSGYIDSSTAAISVSFVVYNSQVEVFMLVSVEFTIEEGGSIKLVPSISSLRADPYSTATDRFRAVLEIIFIFVVIFNVFVELGELAALATASAVAIELANPVAEKQHDKPRTSTNTTKMSRRQRLQRAAAGLPNWYSGLANGGYFNGFLMYTTSFWNVVDLLNISLQVYSMHLWASYYFDHARSFRPQVRYDGLVEIGRTERWMQLHAGDLSAGAEASMGFAGVEYTFLELQAMTGLLTSLRTVSCYSIALMTFRTLKLLDFQPRLGLVTRTIAKASQDLLHFGLIFMFVFFAYASMGHLTFGSAVTEFSTLGKSCMVCMSILLGDIDVQTDLYRSNYIAASFFFWTFVFIAFFILINMLLAILVDAYVAVKDEAEGNRTVPQDCYHMFSSMLPSNTIHRRHVNLVTDPLQRSFEMAARRRQTASSAAEAEEEEEEEGTSKDAHSDKHHVRSGSIADELSADLSTEETSRRTEGGGAAQTAVQTADDAIVTGSWRDVSGGDTVAVGTARVTKAMLIKSLRKLLPPSAIKVGGTHGKRSVADMLNEDDPSQNIDPEAVPGVLAESIFKQLEHWVS
jgi:hypothetical protein